MRSPALPTRRFGVSWCWSLDHSWGIWLDREAPHEIVQWRFNCGPLHVVRFP